MLPLPQAVEEAHCDNVGEALPQWVRAGVAVGHRLTDGEALVEEQGEGLLLRLLLLVPLRAPLRLGLSEVQPEAD